MINPALCKNLNQPVGDCCVTARSCHKWGANRLPAPFCAPGPALIRPGADGVTVPDGIDGPRWDRNNPFWEAVMSEIATVCADAWTCRFMMTLLAAPQSE